MNLLKELIELNEAKTFSFDDIKSAVLKTAEATMNVAGAYGADPIVEDDRVYWAVRYEFPEHGDMLPELKQIMGKVGVVDSEFNTEDEFDEFGNYSFYINLKIKLTSEQVKELQAELEKVITHD